MMAVVYKFKSQRQRENDAFQSRAGLVTTIVEAYRDMQLDYKIANEVCDNLDKYPIGKNAINHNVVKL